MTASAPDRPLRILHIIPGVDFRAGGVAVAVAGLAAAQLRIGLDVRLLATYLAGNDNSPADALRAAGARVQLIGPATGRFLRHPDLESAVRSAVAHADVVHIHALWEEIQHQAAVAARRTKVPCIISPHGMLDPWSLNQSKWKKRLYMLWRLRGNLNHAAAIHYTTPIERDLAARLRLKPQTIVEPNGLDMSEFDHLPARGAFRTRQNVPPDRPVVLFLSRLHHKKGLDLLITAFARANLPDALLVIAGPDDSNYRPQLETMLADHGLTGRALFTGMLRGRDRLEAFVDADLFCLPSYQENFGIAVAEALACATPVVISDQVNIHPDITQANVGGVVPLDVDRLAAELHRWMTDTTLKERAIQNARPFVRDRYDWQNIARRWRDHYQTVARAPRP